MLSREKGTGKPPALSKLTAQRSATSASATSPSPPNNRPWRERIDEFVRQYESSSEQGVDSQLALYASNVRYFGDQQRDHTYIRTDVEKYRERWPVRHGSIEGDIDLQEKIPDKEYAASYKLNFYAESTARAQWSKGQFAIDLVITVVDGVPRISGIKEKILRQQKGNTKAVAPNKSNQSAAAPYPYGILIPGKPGFVKSPYAPSKGYIDIRHYRKGAEVKCPFTGKIFLAP
jgi:hypothetical protein